MIFLGELLKREGLITERQLQEALHIQDASTVYKPLGQILIDQGLILPERLRVLLDTHNKRAPLGEILIRSKQITQEQLEIALSKQDAYKSRLGETLVALDYLSEESLKEALALHLNLPYLDLTCYTPDPELQKTINRSYARKHKLVVMGKTGNRITLAMDDPTSLAIIKELETLGFAVDRAVATLPKYGLVQKVFKQREIPGKTRIDRPRKEDDEWLH